MSQQSINLVVSSIRSSPVLASREEGSAQDSVLLDRFVIEGDEQAFETLVLRHGPRVLRICRRELGDGQDADDAFQATFVVLLKRSRTDRAILSLEVWLSGVAKRVAARAKQQLALRHRREEGAMEILNVAGPASPDPDDLQGTIREEVRRLPEEFRTPMELFYLEGLNCQQAAEHLDCPAGTVKWRLSRGRDLLRSRLTRLGISLAALFLFRPAGATRAEARTIGADGDLTSRSLLDGSCPPNLPAGLLRRTLDLVVLLRERSPVRPEHSVRPDRKARPSQQHLLLLLALAALLIAGLTASYSAVVTDPRGTFETLSTSSNVVPSGCPGQVSTSDSR